MKKMVCVICLIAICGGALMATNKPKIKEWQGFRGLKWGMVIKDMNDPNMVLMFTSEDKRTTGWVRKTDKLFIGKAKLEHIYYFCYREKFFYVDVETKGDLNGDRLKEAVFAYYGEGEQPNQFIEEWRWLHPANMPLASCKAWAILKQHMFGEKTIFSVGSVPIAFQQIADDKKDAEDAKDDF